MTKLSATGSLLKTILRVFDPLIVYDAYTFRWLGFDPHEHDNTREQAFTKVTNVGLISELVFTVWVSWLDVVASTSFDNYGTSWSEEIKGVASSFLCTGMFFFLFSVINSVLVLLAVNETEDDHQATRLLQRLDLWFTIPSIYFYLGVEFLILCVYDTRVEANLKIPSHPTWLKCLRQKSKDNALPAKPTEEGKCVTPLTANDDELSAMELLEEAALESIGQHSLLPLFVDSGWDDFDALAGLQEHHVTQIARIKPGHIARLLRYLRRQLEAATKKAS